MHWGILVAWLVAAPAPVFAAEGRAIPPYSREPADKAGCERNLNQIFEALQKYQEQHGKLPDKLSDLVPDFVHDSKTLQCPFVQRTLDLRSWRERIRLVGSEDRRTSYAYDFCLEKLSPDFWRGVALTQRQFKERQKDEVGPAVPVVRCFAHAPWDEGPHLNLAFDGRIYESELYWEHQHAPRFSVADLEPEKLFAAKPLGRDAFLAMLPARDSRADSRLIDLSAAYNGLLSQPWQGYPGNDLAHLPVGLQDFGGVRFDVRGVVQLHGMYLPIRHPERVDCIRISRSFRWIHFLHGASLDETTSRKIGSYILHYADGQAREKPILYGQDVMDWWVDPKRPARPTAAQAILTGENEAARSYGRSIRLCQIKWENPRPDVEVASLSFVSEGTKAAPFLVAVTVEP